MSLQHLILGILSLEGAQSGYDIKQFIDESTQYFWYSDYSQVYRALNSIEQEGWATVQLDPTNQRNRKTYTITPAGREAFQAWVEADFEIGQLRSPNVGRIFFGMFIPDERLREQISEHKAYWLGVQAVFSRIHDQLKNVEAKQYPEYARYWLLSIDLGRRVIQAYIDWCETILETIEETE